MSKIIPNAQYAPPSSRIPRVLWIGGALALLVCVLCLGIGIGAYVAAPQSGGDKGIAKTVAAEQAKGGLTGERVTRANYRKLVSELQTLHQAEAILGPSREDSRLDGAVHVSWHSRSGKCTINASFQQGNAVSHIQDGKKVYSPVLQGSTISGD